LRRAVRRDRRSAPAPLRPNSGRRSRSSPRAAHHCRRHGHCGPIPDCRVLRRRRRLSRIVGGIPGVRSDENRRISWEFASDGWVTRQPPIRCDGGWATPDWVGTAAECHKGYAVDDYNSSPGANTRESFVEQPPGQRVASETRGSRSQTYSWSTATTRNISSNGL